MPENSGSQQTERVLERITDHLLTHEGDSIEGMMSVNGFNFAGRGQTSAALFIQMKPWDERSGAGQDVFSVVDRANAAFSQYNDAMVIAFAPPAIMELGNATGFNFYLQDRGGQGHEALMAARDQFLYEASQHPAMMMVRPNGMNDEPQYQIIIDDERVRTMGLSLADVNSTMSAAWGSAYVNDFLDGDRVKKVYVQGEASSRVTPEDFSKWYVRNADGDMVPFSAFATGEWVVGSPRMDRFNGLPAVEILGEPAPGHSSGDAMAAVEEIAAGLPQGFTVEWAGLSYEERATGNQAPMLHLLSGIVIFLCLAALYESWSIPSAVMLVIPLGVLGATAAVLMRGLGNDVFFQIGLLATAGLAAKNAILIVEFARDLNQKEGMGLVEAAIHAARLRLRPIIMTSLAFILGVVPLAIATGASSGSVVRLAGIPSALPSSVLLSRPDILAAEHAIRAANGSIGAARAAFFPRIVLTGTAGTASADLSNLFSSGTGAWSFLPRLDLPVFDFGNRQANLDLARVRRDIRITQYERSIQAGFREVADALAARSRYVDQLQAQEDLVDEAQRTHTLSSYRYETGIDSFLQVLDAQRTLFNAQQSLLATRAQEQLNLVELYRALGGGWEER